MVVQIRMNEGANKALKKKKNLKWFHAEVKATHFQKWICIYLRFANAKTAPKK